MKCKKCGSKRIVSLYGKCSDMCNVEFDGHDMEGYVPDDMGIGGGDDIQFKYCLNCGCIQGEFPLPKTELEIGSVGHNEERAAELKEKQKDTRPIDINSYQFEIDTPEGLAKMKKKYPGLGTTSIEEYMAATGGSAGDENGML